MRIRAAVSICSITLMTSAVSGAQTGGLVQPATPATSAAPVIPDRMTPEAVPAAATETQALPAPAPRRVAADAVEEKSVAILDLRASEATADVAGALNMIVTAEVAAARGFRAISRNDLRTMLAHQSEVQMMGCTDVSCMADIAKLAAADFLVSGGIEQLEDSYVFSLELVDPKIPRVIERQTATWRDDPNRMVELARPYVARLLAGPKAQEHVGSLEIITLDKASIVLDGNAVGAAPLEHTVQNLPTGVHTLEVVMDGYLPARHDVVVVNNETTLARIDLVDAESLKPWYSKWWVWGSVGGGLALIGGGVAIVAAAALAEQPTTFSFAE